MNQTVHIPDWQDHVKRADEGPQPNFLVKENGFRVILGGLEAGQQIPEHPEYRAVYHFLEGTGVMIVDGERYPVAAGTTLVVPKGAVRGVDAETRLAFLAVRVGD